MTRGMNVFWTGCWTALHEATKNRSRLFVLFLAVPMLAVAGPSVGAAALAAQDTASGVDPRVGLAPGWHDAGVASSNIELVASLPKGVGFVNPDSAFASGYTNSDIAFTANYAIRATTGVFRSTTSRTPPTRRFGSPSCVPGARATPRYTAISSSFRYRTRRRASTVGRRGWRTRSAPRGSAASASSTSATSVTLYKLRWCKPAEARTRTPSSKTPGTTRMSTSMYRGRAPVCVPPRSWRAVRALGQTTRTPSFSGSR